MTIFIQALQEERLRLARRLTAVEDLLAAYDAVEPVVRPREQAEKKASVEELAEAILVSEAEEKPQPEPIKSIAVAARKESRPVGLPTNFEMVRVAIAELGGSASAPDIQDFIRKRWWPGIPKDWRAVLWGFAGEGRLARAGTGFKMPDGNAPQQEEIKPKPPAPTKVLDQIEFRHGASSVLLHPRENAIATRLRSAMGSGHLDAKFLAEAAAGRKVADYANWMSEMVSAMKPKLESVGLRIDYYKGFGYLMREVAA